MIFRKLVVIVAFVSVVVVVVVVFTIFSVILLIVSMLVMTTKGSVILDRPVIAYRTPLKKPLRHRNVPSAHAIRRPLSLPSGRTRFKRLHINVETPSPRPIALLKSSFLTTFRGRSHLSFGPSTSRCLYQSFSNDLLLFPQRYIRVARARYQQTVIRARIYSPRVATAHAT